MKLPTCPSLITITETEYSRQGRFIEIRPYNPLKWKHDKTLGEEAENNSIFVRIRNRLLRERGQNYVVNGVSNPRFVFLFIFLNLIVL